MPNPLDISEPDMDAIDRLLADELPAFDAAALHRRAAAEPALAIEIARQRALDAVIARATPFPPAGRAAEQIARAIEALRPDAPPSDSARRHPGPRGTPTLPRHLRRFPLLTAAALVAATAAALAIWSGLRPGGGPSHSPTPFCVVAADGFRASISETDPALLETTLSEKLGVAVALPRGPAIRYLGLRTDIGDSPLAVGIVALVGDRHVVLTLDRAAPGAAAPSAIAALPQGTYRHERIVGPIRVVEWSDSPAPLFTSLTAR